MRRGHTVPVRCAKTGERGYHVYAVGILHFGGEVLGVEGIADELHLVAQPLNRRPGHKHRPFQSVVHPPRGPQAMVVSRPWVEVTAFSPVFISIKQPVP